MALSVPQLEMHTLDKGLPCVLLRLESVIVKVAALLLPKSLVAVHTRLKKCQQSGSVNKDTGQEMRNIHINHGEETPRIQFNSTDCETTAGQVQSPLLRLAAAGLPHNMADLKLINVYTFWSSSASCHSVTCN